MTKLKAVLEKESINFSIHLALLVLTGVALLGVEKGTHGSVNFIVIISIILLLFVFFRTIFLQTQIRKYKEESLRNLERTLSDIHNIVGLSTHYLTNLDDDNVDKAYERSLEVIKSSNHSILIIGDYSPKEQVLDTTHTRNDYLTAIESKITEKSNDKKSFQYVRIQQRDENSFQQIKSNNGKIASVEVVEGDIQSFKHCKRILDGPALFEKVDVKLYATPFIPSLPSILLVDNKHLLFTIPKKKEGFGLKTASVIHFIDNRLASPMIKSFEEIIKSVTGDEDEICRIRKIEDIFN